MGSITQFFSQRLPEAIVAKPGVGYNHDLEFADNGKQVIAGSQTTPIGIYVDNSQPTAIISEIRWRVQGETTWRDPALTRKCAASS